MEEKLTMDDFKEELEASYKAAEEAAPEADDEADPVWAELKQPCSSTWVTKKF